MAKNNSDPVVESVSVDPPMMSVAMPEPVDDGNREFPVALVGFLDNIRGTDLEVWSHWLRKNHGAEAHTLGEWRAVVDKWRDQPAHPTVIGGG
jgi:hypothetical protein